MNHPSLNSRLQKLQAYPFTRLAALLKDLNPNPRLEHISLAVGEPQHAPPAFVADLMQESLSGINRYPTTRGGEKLRQAIAAWIEQRYGLGEAGISAHANILPVQGSREALFATAQFIVDTDIGLDTHFENDSDLRSSTELGGSSDLVGSRKVAAANGEESLNAGREKPVVLMPSPFYQIYEGAAIMAGAEPVYLPLKHEENFSFDLSRLSEDVLKRCALVYVCNPSNPTGATISLDQYEQILAFACQYDFVVASDECYSEIYQHESEPVPSLLQAAYRCRGRFADAEADPLERCLVFNSLSKRSNLAGLRSGFVVGGAALIEAFFLYRTYHGSAMPLHHQAISAACWRDETHVISNRQAYRSKLDSACEQLLASEALKVQRPEGGFCLWIKIPGCDQAFAESLFRQHAVTVLPGSFLARPVDNINAGSGYIRVALVHSQSVCEEALSRLVAHAEALSA